MLSGPDLQKAGSYGGKPAERHSQIAKKAGSRNAICSTATSITVDARPREQWPCKREPSMQVRSQQTSGPQQGAPRSKALADESCATCDGLAGRTRIEADSRHHHPHDESHEELSLGAL